MILKHNLFLKLDSIFFLFIVLLLINNANDLAFAQESANHPELEWQTIETDHFFVHYHNGTERTAREVAKIAEYVFPTITKLYHHVPDQKVTFVIRDHDDYSNGASYFYDNKIELWAPALDFEFRGIHPWLWNVVTHEYTHLVQIQTLMKFGRKVPSIYLQWLGYERERRPDILYGYPNVLVSYPISGFVLPSWFAEGVAQYNSPELEYDYWDSHRDMILRMAVLKGTLLSWNEMGVFGKNSLGNESAYNAGFSLVQYIADEYGVGSLKKISRELSKVQRLTIDEAIYKVLGKNGNELYEEWKSKKFAQYTRVADSLQAQEIQGSVIEGEGFGNVYSAFSPDGKWIAYISNKNMDYLSLSSIYLYDRNTGKKKIFVPGVHSTISFSPDGRYIYYSKISQKNKRMSGYSDIYSFDIKRRKEKRLTFGLRAFNPQVSKDGSKIVFTYGNDGTLNLGMCNNDGSGIHSITHFNNGEQVFTPSWSPDGKTIAFGFSESHGQQLALIDTSGENFQSIVSTGDSRNPVFTNDGMKILFSWDRTGIFNLYEYSLSNDSCVQMTNVLGGAFAPAIDQNDSIVYSLYTSTGYKIALLTKEQLSNISVDVPREPIQLPASYQVPSIPENQLVAKPYRSKFTSLSLIPILRVDLYNEKNKGIDAIKPGLYFSSNEMLDNMTLFGGASLNKRLERDIFLILEYRDRLPIFYQLGLSPTLTLELYNITRSIDYTFELYIDKLEKFTTNVDYDLFEFDVALTHPIWSKNNNIEFRYMYSKYNQDFGSWLHPRAEFGVVKATRSTYLISHIFSLRWQYDGILPTVDRDINPIGRSLSLKYSYELNNYNPRDSAEYKNGFRVPIYTPYNFHRLELSYQENIPLPIKHHVLVMKFHGGTIPGHSVDEFFNFYTGGFVGMRGYPFYAIGGNEMATVNLAYHFPISEQLNFRFLQMYFKKMYGVFFYDFGNAWTGAVPQRSDWKSDAGFEIRLESFSWYAYPTRIFFSGAYGFNQFTKEIDALSSEKVTYGKEWRFYLGVLFGFELSDISKTFRIR